MKALKITFLLLLVALVLTFAYQNLEKVTVSFVVWSITVPFSLTTFLSFIIGVLAGGLAIFSLKKKGSDKKSTEAKVENAKTENKQHKTDFIY